MTLIVLKGSTQAAIALGLWFPIVVALFAFLHPRRAMIFAFIFAWMFLPVATYFVVGIPDITKMNVTGLGVLVGTALFHSHWLRSFRFRWFDLPLVVFCVTPLLTSLTNGLGIYDGITGVTRMATLWGLPYFLGRVYIKDFTAVREVVIGLFIGGLVYVPFVLYEVRMSPQLHKIVYGYFPHAFSQTVRYGGWRANVFMEHGLMVGMWLTAATVSGVWLRMGGTMKSLYGVPLELLIAVLMITCALQKSTGSLILLVLGLVLLMAVYYLRSNVPITAMGCVCVLYIVFRSMGIWDGGQLINAFSKFLPEERVLSMNFRFESEMAIAQHALQRPLFGWGGWGRSMVYDDKGRRTVVTDSMWIVYFGENGYSGLISLTGLWLLPVLLFHRRIPPSAWRHPAIAPSVAAVLVLLLWTIDCLANAMFNPIFVVLAGGLAGLAPSAAPSFRRVRSAPMGFDRRPVVYNR